MPLLRSKFTIFFLFSMCPSAIYYRELNKHGEVSLAFTGDSSTSANDRDNPSGNEIRRKHRNKQNHPNLPPIWKTVQARGICVQCFHWPNITTCGKYPCTCVMCHFLFLQRKCKHKRKHKKGNIFDPCA